MTPAEAIVGELLSLALLILTGGWLLREAWRWFFPGARFSELPPWPGGESRREQARRRAKLGARWPGCTLPWARDRETALALGLLPGESNIYLAGPRPLPDGGIGEPVELDTYGYPLPSTAPEPENTPRALPGPLRPPADLIRRGYFPGPVTHDPLPTTGFDPTPESGPAQDAAEREFGGPCNYPGCLNRVAVFGAICSPDHQCPNGCTPAHQRSHGHAPAEGMGVRADILETETLTRHLHILAAQTGLCVFPGCIVRGTRTSTSLDGNILLADPEPVSRPEPDDGPRRIRP